MQASNISWCDMTWNPVVGCTKIAPGCKNCYAEELHTRRHEAYKRGAKLPAQYASPFGEIQLMQDRLTQPLKRRKPAVIFVNSVSDLFHEHVPMAFVHSVLSVVVDCPQHTFIVLTKRASRMSKFLLVAFSQIQPPDNLWLGVSVSNQSDADALIPDLLATPAAHRFISYEPALGPIDFSGYFGGPYVGLPGDAIHDNYNAGINLIIMGGESGSHARPMHPDWARSTRDQCAAAGVAFYMKQRGEFITIPEMPDNSMKPWDVLNCNTAGRGFVRVGTKRAGRLLDGVLHDALPWRKVEAQP